MAGGRSKRNQQHPNRQPPVKKQKCAQQSDAVSNENSIDVTKITNLNHDCLEKIFDRLFLFNDILNVALSNKSLQVAAASAYKRKFGIKQIDLDPTDTAAGPIFVRERAMWISGLKSCLQFVRCFGENITDLVMSYGSNDHLNQYIQQYCAESLTKISFLGVKSLHVNSFERPFNNVNVVKIEGDYSRNALSHFIDWFPNMRHLILTHNTINADAITFPQLVHLEIYSQRQQNCVELMRANPQLQTVELHQQTMKMKQSLDIIEFNGSISKLKISYCFRDICVTPTDSKRLVRDHPLLVELHLPQHKFEAKAVMILVRQLNALKMFRFKVKSQSVCDEILKQLDNEWRHELSNCEPGTRSKAIEIKLSR